MFFEGAKWIGFRRESPPRLTLNFDACTRPECLLRGEVQLRHLFGWDVRECYRAVAVSLVPSCGVLLKSRSASLKLAGCLLARGLGRLMAKKPIAKTPVKKVAKKAPAMPAPKARPARPAVSVAKTAVAKKSPAVVVPARPKPIPAEAVSSTGVSPEVQLSQLDEQLVGLLNKRASLYLEKMKGVQTPSKIMISDQDQQQVWSMIDRVNQGPLTSAEIKTIFRPLMSAGRQRIKRHRSRAAAR